MQQSWDLLVPLLKLGEQFTLGFMNQRVLLNSSLVSSTNLIHLESEFAKREIAAITFRERVTLKAFKLALGLLTTRPMVIVQRGGIKQFLAANPIEGVHVTPAAKPKEEGDMTEVGMDFESFLTAQAIMGSEGSAGSRALDMLMDAAGVKRPQGADMSPQELVAMATTATRNTMAEPDGNMADLLIALTQMLSALKPEFVVAALPPQKQADLQGCPPAVVSAHLMEDAIAGWAAERLGSAVSTEDQSSGGEGGDGGGSRGNVEKEVLQALLRGLKATRVAERLMQKFAQFVEQANLPREVYERIYLEVMWFTLPAETKHAHLLHQGQFTSKAFAHLVKYVQEAVSEGRISEAAEVTRHYFSVWAKAPSAARAEELKRVPEFLRAMASVQTLSLMHTLAEPLIQEILDETLLHWPCHLEAANCLAILAQSAGQFDDFEFVHKIAAQLKRSMARRPSQHADCCGKALAGLLPPPALEKLVESFLQRRADSAWVRTATSLLAMIGPLGAEVALRRLESEPVASNRMPLIRLIRGLGASAIEPTRKRLSDPQWYVVRNAVYILEDLGDPELPAQLRGAIRHADLRVQRAAITAILKSNLAGRAGVLAEVLTELHAEVLEMVLDELTVLKDAASVEHLESFILGKQEFKAGVREKAVVALAAVPSDRAAEALYRIIGDAAQPLMVRRTALAGLYSHGSSMAASLAAQLPSLPSGGPLAA